MDPNVMMLFDDDTERVFEVIRVTEAVVGNDEVKPAVTATGLEAVCDAPGVIEVITDTEFEANGDAATDDPTDRLRLVDGNLLVDTDLVVERDKDTERDAERDVETICSSRSNGIPLSLGRLDALLVSASVFLVANSTPLPLCRSCLPSEP